MKKIISFILMGAMLLLVSCCDVSRGADVEGKIAGTWACDNWDRTWVFDGNGKMTIDIDDGVEFVYEVVGSKLAFYVKGAGQELAVYDVTVSKDGRKLILSGTGGTMGNRVWMTKSYLLKKKS